MSIEDFVWDERKEENLSETVPSAPVDVEPRELGRGWF
jgi:hypothetical protein